MVDLYTLFEEKGFGGGGGRCQDVDPAASWSGLKTLFIAAENLTLCAR